MRPVIGVLGGLGPKTTAEFYLRLVQLGTKVERPAVSIWSLPLDVQKEAEYVTEGRHQSYYLSLMTAGLDSLVRAGSSFVAIPCNTVHEFHVELAHSVKVPVVNLIQVVTDEVKARGWERILLLATSRTIETRLYQQSLGNARVDVVIPEPDDQIRLDNLILGLLGDRAGDDQQKFLATIAKKSGCNQIVLGCTDLQLAFAADANRIDSMEALAQAVSQLI